MAGVLAGRPDSGGVDGPGGRVGPVSGGAPLLFEDLRFAPQQFRSRAVALVRCYASQKGSELGLSGSLLTVSGDRWLACAGVMSWEESVANSNCLMIFTADEEGG